MASFVSPIVKFRPYVPTLPVEAITKVGMVKQQQYEKGLQQVNQIVQGISDLPVDSTFSPYLNDKLDQLKKHVNNTVSGDLSNRNVVNYIESSAKQIAKDPVIINAISSTARVKKSLEDLEKARTTSNGEYYNPANEEYLKHHIAAWRKNVQDGNLKAQFDGGYTPYSDYNSHVLEGLKAAGIETTEDPYTIDESGHRVINPALLKKSGISPDRVRSIINASLTEADKKQLAIEGWYNYRGIDAGGMSKLLNTNLSSTIKQKQDYLTELETQSKTVDTNNPEKQKELREEIKRVKASIAQTTTTRDNLSHEINSGNLDSVKSRLYTTLYRDNLISAYSTQSREFKNNPYWQAHMDMLNYQQKIRKYQDTLNKDNKKDNDKTIGLLQGAIAGKAGDTMTNSEILSSYHNRLDNLNTELDGVKSKIKEVVPNANVSKLISDYHDSSKSIDIKIRPLVAQADLISQQKQASERLLDIADKEAQDRFPSSTINDIKGITIDGTYYSGSDIAQFVSDEAEQRKRYNETHKYVDRQSIVPGVNPASDFEFIPRDDKQARLYHEVISTGTRNPIHAKLKEVGDKQVEIEKDRTDYVATKLSKSSNLFQTLYIGVGANDSETKDKLGTQVINKLSSMTDAGYEEMQESNNGRYSDRDELNKMISGKDQSKTKYNIVIDKNAGMTYIGLTNASVSDKTNWVPYKLDKFTKQFPQWTPRQYNYEDNIKNWIEAGGTSTTNWSPNQDPTQAKFQGEYFPRLKNQSRFSVTADIWKTPGMNSYGIEYHIFDNQNPDDGWVTRSVDQAFTFDKLGTVRNIFQGTGVEQIKQLLGITN